MSDTPAYGAVWFQALAEPAADPSLPASLLAGPGVIGPDSVAVLALVADSGSRFPRARHGEAGVEEGWGLAAAVSRIVEDDASSESPRSIVIVVDVPSQAYGYVEELLGVHQALAASVEAIARARLRGHPVIGFVVGKAISGAFLATGLQANRLVALDHADVAVQVMSKQSAARITRRSVAELDAVALRVPAAAYDIASFATLGALHAVIHVDRPGAPDEADIEQVRAALAEAVAAARSGPADLSSRLQSPEAARGRAASIMVRQVIDRDWDASA